MTSRHIFHINVWRYYEERQFRRKEKHNMSMLPLGISVCVSSAGDNHGGSLTLSSLDY